MARALLAAALASAALAQNVTCVPSGSLYSGKHTTTLINGSAFSFADWNGSVTIISNVASFW